MSEGGTTDLVGIDRALLAMRRFFVPPAIVDDGGDTVETSTLLVLDGLDPAGETVGDVARRLDVTHSTASRFVTRAERSGMVTRSPSPADARAMLVVATGAGLALSGRAASFRLQRLAEIVEGWDATEVSELAAGLQRFAASGARLGVAPPGKG